MVHGEDYSGYAPPVGERLKTTYPEVESYTRVYADSYVMDLREGEKIRVNYLMADSAFFNMFSFKLIEGDPNHVLATRFGIVFTESFARKTFGDESPVGNEVTFGKLSFMVTGIMEDLPRNTHFRETDAIVNFRALAGMWGWEELLTTYGNSSFGLYFMAREGTDLPAKGPVILEDFRKDYWIFQNGRNDTLRLESLVDCYYSKHYSPGIKRNNKSLIMILSGIVILILILAIINYVNLTVSQAGFRGKEAAMRKILGSSKRMLVRQFIGESIMVCFVSFGIALVLSLLAEPVVSNLLGTELQLSSEFTLLFFAAAASFLILVGIISGIVPTLVISRFSPVEVVKGSLRKKTKSTYSKILISFQYLVAISLLICTWMVTRQTLFLQNYDPGFTRENLIKVENHLHDEEVNTFKNMVREIAGVERVAFVSGSPVDGGNNQSWMHEGKPVSFQEFLVDSAFLEMMDFEITPTGAAYDKKGMYLNETAVRELELDPLPTSFKRYETEIPVLGIVKDFNFRNLYEPIGPCMIGQLQKDWWAWSIFVETDGLNDVNTVRDWYKKEENTSRIIGYFSLLTIVLAIMGVFAMSNYFIQQRIKDIGIRKVNGAQSVQILRMLSADFLKWVFLAFLIASPLSWYAIQNLPSIISR
jgi:putative ABC transport system permease protein